MDEWLQRLAGQNEIHREIKKVNCEPTRCIVSLQNEVHREIKKVKCEPTRCIVSIQNEVYASYKDLNLWLVVEELHVVEECLGLGFLGALRLVFGLDVSTADQLDVRFPRSKNAKRLNTQMSSIQIIHFIPINHLAYS